jgi:hypothetical protein
VSIVSAPSRRSSALPLFVADARASETKKADVAEHPQVFDHVGLLIDGPPGLSRVAPHLVFRRFVRPAARRFASRSGNARDGNRGESETQADQGKTVDFITGRHGAQPDPHCLGWPRHSPRARHKMLAMSAARIVEDPRPHLRVFLNPKSKIRRPCGAGIPPARRY